MKNRDPVKVIKQLIPSLPDSDQKFAYKFLDERDFESLQLLVNSSIIRVKRGLSAINPKQEYVNASIDGMQDLKWEVDSYYELINWSLKDNYDLQY